MTEHVSRPAVATRVIKRREQVDDSHLPADLPATLRQVLARRGVAHVDELQLNAQGLLHFSGLSQIDTAAQRIAEAIAAQQPICVVGDFDADGATSTALLMLALPAFGVTRLFYLVPNRFTDGYGLTAGLVEAAHQQGAKLIITVDNGIAAHDGVNTANGLGIDVIVTDHHLPGATLPAAYAVVNPTLPDCGFASRHLAGVGVAFYLLLALRHYYRQQQHRQQQHRQRDLPQANVNVAQWLDLVALGTVADVVPFDYNNRILVQQGLARIRAGRCRPGILALLQVSGRDPKQLQAQDLGFTVAPRINAAGRLDDIQIGIECLLSDNPERVQALAVQLDTLNRERRSTEQSMRDDAEKYLASLQFDSAGLPPVLTLHQDSYHQGVIGILAGRVKEQVYRPVIAFATAEPGVLKGSARSIPGVHIRDVLERVSTLQPQCITAFGGHAMAAGLTVPQAMFSQFRQCLNTVASEWIDDELLQPVLWSDGELAADELTLTFVQALRSVGPWGQQFSEPLFDGHFRVVQQRILKERHLKLVVTPLNGGPLLDAIAFNIDPQPWLERPPQSVELVYRLQQNEFRGQISLQLMIEHLQAC